MEISLNEEINQDTAIIYNTHVPCDYKIFKVPHTIRLNSVFKIKLQHGLVKDHDVITIFKWVFHLNGFRQINKYFENVIYKSKFNFQVNAEERTTSRPTSERQKIRKQVGTAVHLTQNCVSFFSRGWASPSIEKAKQHKLYYNRVKTTKNPSRLVDQLQIIQS